MKKFLCICLSSTIQRTITFEKLTLTKVNRSKKYRQDASGKAVNSARVLNQLEKGCVTTICPLGKENQDLFLSLAEKDELELLTAQIPGFTRECWTLLDKTNYTTTELVVSEPEPSNEQINEIQKAEIKLLKLITRELPKVDAVLLAGSRPSFWSEDLYSTICGIAKDNNKFILADFIGKDLLNCLNNYSDTEISSAQPAYSAKTVHTHPAPTPDVVKINDEEFCKTFNLNYPLEIEELKKQILLKSSEYKNIFVITRGKDSTLAAANGKIYECKSEKITPVNTTACGDSFNAGFLYEYINSSDIQKALNKGTWCAARNAEKEVPGGI
ncbi:MAG: PfkB family carbohydrate kinase [Spirochaetales bacterium]|nr:PfkB family carbohydrate kinase [Spirochaetales bacterium]